MFFGASCNKKTILLMLKNIFRLISLLDYNFSFILPLFIQLVKNKKNKMNTMSKIKNVKCKTLVQCEWAKRMLEPTLELKWLLLQ